MRRHLGIILAAMLLSLCFAGMGEVVSLRILEFVYRSLGRSARIFEDSQGVPIVDYGIFQSTFIGEQRNPLTISNRCRSYDSAYRKGDDRALQLSLRCADWLVENAVMLGDFAMLPYRFPWPVYDLPSPWRSAMAQGHAIQALIRTYETSGDPKYLDLTRKLLRSFFVEVKDGGVTYKSEEGWWYEEFAAERGPESRVLNGMMSVLISLHDYYERTRDPDAGYLFDRGVAALQKQLPRYDDDGYSQYDMLDRSASHSYHRLHIKELEDLYRITGHPIFREYALRWQEYESLIFLAKLWKNPTKVNFLVLALTWAALAAAIEALVLVFTRAPWLSPSTIPNR